MVTNTDYKIEITGGLLSHDLPKGINRSVANLYLNRALLEREKY